MRNVDERSVGVRRPRRREAPSPDGPPLPPAGAVVALYGLSHRRVPLHLDRVPAMTVRIGDRHLLHLVAQAEADRPIGTARRRRGAEHGRAVVRARGRQASVRGRDRTATCADRPVGRHVARGDPEPRARLRVRRLRLGERTGHVERLDRRHRPSDRPSGGESPQRLTSTQPIRSVFGHPVVLTAQHNRPIARGYHHGIPKRSEWEPAARRAFPTFLGGRS
jgi:hypothetical protein